MLDPIIVYLDSSDYSRLSDPKLTADPTVSRARAYIDEALEGGRIEIRFSMVHVIEACHHGPAAHSQAVARGRLIKRLSAERTMKYFAECIACELSGAEGRNAALDDDGRWYPKHPGLGREIQSAITEGIKHALARTPQNRQQRRILKKAFGTPEHLNRNIRQHLVDDPTLVSDLAEKHGMSPAFIRDRLFHRLAQNEHNYELTEREILRELFDPENFVSHYVDRLDKGDRLRSTVTGLGEKLVEGIQALRDVIDSLPDPRSNPDLIRNLRATLKSTAKATQDALRLKIYTALTSSLDGAPKGPPADIAFPGLDTLVKACQAWLLDVADPSNPRNPRRSDAGDLLHLFFLPYVDVWRGDGYSASLARRIRVSGDGIAVADLSELERVVENLAAKRHSASARHECARPR